MQNSYEYEEFKKEILDATSDIHSLTSLHPSVEVNAKFSRLVALITRSFDDERLLSEKLVSDPELLQASQYLRRACAGAEGHLESHWADVLIPQCPATQRSWTEYLPRWTLMAARQTARLDPLLQFPYYDNYRCLVHLEYSLLQSIGASFDNTLFVGSGPLPLSPLLLARDFLTQSSTRRSDQAEGWSMTNVDVSVAALEQGARLTSAVLGTVLNESRETGEGGVESVSYATKFRAGVIHFLQSDAVLLPPEFIASFNVIFLAALVGDNDSDESQPSKRDIALYLIRHMKPGSLLLLHSAQGSRSIIYPQVDEVDLLRGARSQGKIVKMASPH